MVKTRDLQTSFVSGVLGADFDEREDIEDYFSGARDIHNMDPRPQGGVALRPGLAFFRRLRNVLDAIDVGGGMVTFGAQVSGGGVGDAPDPPPADPDPYPDLPDWLYLTEGGGGLQ